MIFDLHNDYLTSSFFCDNSVVFDDMVTYAVWTTKLTDPVTFLQKVKSQKIKNIALEDLHFINRENMFILNSVKPIYASLTWNYENVLAGGSDTDIGLTKDGEFFIKFLEESNITLDVAHLSRKAFYDTVKLINKPIISSHTCFNSIFDHSRNLTDEQIKLIIESGGIIGLGLVSSFMGKKQADESDVIKQIDYFVNKFGANNLAIGSDFFGTDYPAIPSYRGFKSLKNNLIGLGYSEVDIEKILYLNAANFYKIKN